MISSPCKTAQKNQPKENVFEGMPAAPAIQIFTYRSKRTGGLVTPANDYAEEGRFTKTADRLADAAVRFPHE
jgi:hypothetical protein